MKLRRVSLQNFSRSRTLASLLISFFCSACQEGSTVVGNSKNIYVSLSEGHTHKCIHEVQIFCNFQQGRYISMWSLDLLSHEVSTPLFFLTFLSVVLVFFLPFNFRLRQRSSLKSDPFVRPKEVVSQTAAQWPTWPKRWYPGRTIEAAREEATRLSTVLVGSLGC